MLWGLWVIFWWGSYSSVYVLLPMYVSPLVLVVYVHVVWFIFLLYILYAYFLIHIALCFTFYQLCEIYPQLDENFWGVYAYVSYLMQLYVHFEICLLDNKLFYVMSLAMLVMLSMWYIDNVCVLAYHSICILLFVCVSWTQSLPILHLIILQMYQLMHNLPSIILHII